VKKAARSINPKNCSARQLASLISKIRYMAEIHRHLLAWMVELEIAKVHHLQKGGWDLPLPLHVEAIEERTHWLSRDSVMKVPIRYHLSKAIETMGDAGPIGFGIEGFKPIAGLWSESERQRSTNWRELMT
jgi:hypothetical protein